MNILGFVAVSLCIPGGFMDAPYWIAMLGCLLIYIGSGIDNID